MSRVLLSVAAVVAGSVAVATAAGGAINHPVPGVFGTVTATGLCPVSRSGPCPPRPVQAAVKVQQQGNTVASTSSNSAGDYAVGVPQPGVYTVVVSSGTPLFTCPPKRVRVKEGQSVQANVTCHLHVRIP